MTFKEYKKPIVLGAPRSGFTLLINVIDSFQQTCPKEEPFEKKFINAVTFIMGEGISRTIEKAFAEKGIKKNLVYSPSFRAVFGGPHWIDETENKFYCFRKYIGVKGYGDFALLVRYPSEIESSFPIEHSHYSPKVWLSDPRFKNHRFFASVRNPVDIISSSCFSFNALTSHYIQQFISHRKDNDDLRKKIALYKLTDLTFFKGLISKLRDYYLEYLDCRDEFHEMRWEDLIGIPGKTIHNISEQLGSSIRAEDTAEIWQQLAYKNLTAAHGHNYRKGHAYVNGWRKTLTNEHLRLMREEGLEDISIKLGYGKILSIDECEYTDYQKKIASYLKKGKIYRRYWDKDLFTFSFNKSNIDASSFSIFKTYEWKKYTRIEQSCFQDESVLNYVWGETENIVNDFNELFYETMNAELTGENYREKLKVILNSYPLLLKMAGFRTIDDCIDKIFENMSKDVSPRLIRVHGKINIVLFKKVFYGIPQSLGPIDLTTQKIDKYDSIKKAGSLTDLIYELSERDRVEGQHA
ncbi:MAG: sulfotransferase domain-containing protein [Desulfobacteraceae bacterium]|nr:sulfotransferase domain-containing protein [Desulfobacteraceae bacterium]